jgi:hypothetical protein
MSFSEDRPKLGSLAQAARHKQLNQVRAILIVIGALTLALNLFLYFNARNEVNEAVKKQIGNQGPFVRVDQEKVEALIRTVSILYLSLAGIGALYILFGIIVHSYPVPVTVLALVIYLGVHAVLLVWVGPAAMGIGFGWIIKLAIVAALIGAVRTAIVYQQERSAELAVENEYEDE